MSQSIRRIDLARVGLRLTLLQSAWCEGALQAAGFAYCLAPGLRRIHQSPEAFGEAIKRFQTPFNTHPYLAGAIAGAVLRMEADGRPPRYTARFARDAMGPLAAVGDPFFRGSLAPAVSLIGALVALLAGAVAGAAALLIAFNAVHLTVRTAGLIAGFNHGEQALIRVGVWIGPQRTSILKWIGVLTGGALLGWLVARLGMPYLGLTTFTATVVGLGCSALLAVNRSAWSMVVLLSLAALVAAEMAI